MFSSTCTFGVSCTLAIFLYMDHAHLHTYFSPACLFWKDFHFDVALVRDLCKTQCLAIYRSYTHAQDTYTSRSRDMLVLPVFVLFLFLLLHIFGSPYFLSLLHILWFSLRYVRRPRGLVSGKGLGKLGMDIGVRLPGEKPLYSSPSGLGWGGIGRGREMEWVEHEVAFKACDCWNWEGHNRSQPELVFLYRRPF